MAFNHYVVVFVFDELCKNVMLVEKQKPGYLKRKWNGVGGKVEETDQSIFHAARRECMEESGIDLHTVNMEHIIHMMFFESVQAKLDNKPLFIDFIMAKTDMIFAAQSMEREIVKVFPLSSVLSGQWYSIGKEQLNIQIKLVSNLYWMLPFAVDRYRTAMLYCEEVQKD